jgi:uroporphyrinogen-III synthase
MTKPPPPLGEGAQQCNLHGLGVLITRPQHQAQSLYDAIKKSGGIPVLFPTIEITAPTDPALCKQQLQNATDYDDLIFISPNAVTYAVADVAIDRQRIFAIGGATAKMLLQHHIPHYLPFEEKADSENLLASPLLGHMQGRRVLIIRGEGGRALLRDTLTERGATVDYAEVYRRRCPDVDATSLLQKWPQEIEAVITTSNAIIDNLLHLCRNDPVVRQTPLIVISQRMLKHADQLGFQHVCCTNGIHETVILPALCRFLRV